MVGAGRNKQPTGRDDAQDVREETFVKAFERRF
jgi:hypothetical protein